MIKNKEIFNNQLSMKNNKKKIKIMKCINLILKKKYIMNKQYKMTLINL